MQSVESLRGDAFEGRGRTKRLGFSFGANGELGEHVRIAAAAGNAPLGKRLVAVAARSCDEVLNESATGRIVEGLEAHETGANAVGTIELTAEITLPRR